MRAFPLGSRAVLVSDPSGGEEDLIASLAAPGDKSCERSAGAWLGATNSTGCTLTIACNSAGDVCGIHKPGNAPISQVQVAEAIARTAARAAAVERRILEATEKKGKQL